MDSDGSHPPKSIPAIHKMFVEEKCDVVIGSRYVKGGVTNDAKSSQIMSHMLNFAFRVCLGLHANDLSTDYRMYHTKQLKKVKLTCENYDVLEEVLLRLKLNKRDKKFKDRGSADQFPEAYVRRVQAPAFEIYHQLYQDTFPSYGRAYPGCNMLNKRPIER